MTRTISIDGVTFGVAADRGGVWVAHWRGTVEPLALLTFVDSQAYNPELVLQRRSTPFFRGSPAPVAVGAGSAWFSSGLVISRVDTGGHTVDEDIEVGGSRVLDIAADADAVWATAGRGGGVETGGENGLLLRIDPETDALARQIPTAADSTVAIGAGAVWLASLEEGAVFRFDPATNTSVIEIPVGTLPTGVAFGEDAVWVANSLSGTVSRIDPGTNQVVATIQVGNHPEGIAVGEGFVWVTVQ